ncbi:TusE/DsrC/DsvC family sulfur relay protein [Nitrincola sp. MINF-07-Sa-05]|uniref:TusE/DsrC/DsvC family sulfur relay protein n=1 Tax=Nitrincola salilacus TaxID=3400273 RepID=UPI00391863DE
MATIEVHGVLHELDSDGYLVDATAWTLDTAQALATLESITLTQEHIEVLDVLRQFYQEYEHSPAMRPLCKAVSKALGPEKGKSIYLMQLFPGSPAKRAARIAGLPRPDNCL